jgi:Flp pilus assembly pilin Flp
MKLNQKSKANRGIAMTEYLIILGIVAIAAIAVVSIFGNSIKDVFYRTTSTLNGTDTSGSNGATLSKSSKTSDTTSTMSNFDSAQNSHK